MNQWETTAIGEVCTVVLGQSPEGQHYNADGEGLPFYQGKKEFGAKYLGPPTTWTRVTQKEARDGDILMSVRAPVGPINFATERICIGRGLAAIRPSSVLDRNFLYYNLLARQEEICGSEGAVFASISKQQIESISLPLPHIAEQKRIVGILDEAFAGIEVAIANAEKNLGNAREVFESQLNRIFSNAGREWVEKLLSEYVSIQHGYAFKGNDFDRSSDITRPIVLTPGNYTTDGQLCFTLRNTKRLTGDFPPEYLFHVGDLTVVMTDLSSKMNILGQPAFVERADVLHNQRIGRVNFKRDGLLPRYLYYFLRTRKVSDKIKKTSTGTMVRHTAPQRILANIIPMPRLEAEQERIVAQLDGIEAKVNELELIHKKQLVALAELKQSILQRAFAGELTAKEAERELAAS
jgi:type I restriction enzyme S subunit